MSALDCLRVALNEIRKVEQTDTDRHMLENTLERIIRDKTVSEEVKLAKARQQVAAMRKAAARKAVSDEISNQIAEGWAMKTDGFKREHIGRLRDALEESGDPRVRRERPSVSSRMRYLEHREMQALNQAFDDYFVGFLNPRPKDTRNLSREMLGHDTGDPVARRAAQMFEERNQMLDDRLRAAGVFVETMPNYRPQNRSPARMARDPERYKREFAALVDPERHPDPRATAEADFNTHMTRHTLEPGAQPLTMGRQIHFRKDDPDRLHAFLEEFGEDTLMRQVQRQMRRKTRAIALAEEFGPDPGRVVRQVAREFDRELALDPNRTRGNQIELNSVTRIFDAVSGTLDTPQSALGANIMSGVRALQIPLYLGRVALSIVGTDSLIAPLQRARVEGYGKAFSLQAQGMAGVLNRDIRMKLRDYYGTYETNMYMGSPNSRFSNDPLAEGFGASMQTFSNAVYRASGAWDIEQGLRQVTSFSIGKGLGDAARVPWRELDPRLVQDLQSSGVTERVWNDVNRFGKVDRYGLFDWSDLPSQSAEVMGSYFHRTVDHSVLRPDNTTRAILFAGGRRGSLPGELTALATQFLNWPIQFTRIAMQQQWKKGVPGFAVFSGALFAGGMVTEQLYAITSGEPAFEWDSPALVKRALRRSGLLTPIGEFAVGGAMGDQFMQPSLGPGVDTVMRTLERTGRIATRTIEGDTDRATAELVRLGTTFVPNVSWFDATVVQPTVQSWLETLDPDSVRRTEQRYRDEGRMGF